MKDLLRWAAILGACLSALLILAAMGSVPVTLWLTYWDQPVTYNQKIGLVVGGWCWLSLAAAWCWHRVKRWQGW